MNNNEFGGCRTLSVFSGIKTVVIYEINVDLRLHYAGASVSSMHIAHMFSFFYYCYYYWRDVSRPKPHNCDRDDIGHNTYSEFNELYHIYSKNLYIYSKKCNFKTKLLLQTIDESLCRSRIIISSLISFFPDEPDDIFHLPFRVEKSQLHLNEIFGMIHWHTLLRTINYIYYFIYDSCLHDLVIMYRSK